MLRLGFLTESKSENSKIATGIPAAYICGHDGIGRHARFRCRHLGERFLRHPRRGHSSVKAGTPAFIAAGQALRSASVPRRVKIRGNKTAAESPAASAFRLDGIGRHDRPLSHTVSMPESRVTLEKLNTRPWWNWQTRWI